MLPGLPLLLLLGAVGPAGPAGPAGTRRRAHKPLPSVPEPLVPLSASALRRPAADDGGKLGGLLGQLDSADVPLGALRQDYLGRRPLLVQPAHTRRLFGRKVARAELLGLAQIDGLLSQARLRYGRGAKFLLNGSTPGLGDVPLGVDLAHDGYRRGATLVVSQVQRLPTLEWVGEEVDALERQLGVYSSANLYLTPPGAQGAAPHFDMDDVVIAQTMGRKHWRVWEPRSVTAPLRDQNAGLREVPPVETASYTATLGPGSLLYIPRGWAHVATAQGEEEEDDEEDDGDKDDDEEEEEVARPELGSIHLTFALHVQDASWLALLRVAVCTGDAATFSAFEQTPLGAINFDVNLARACRDAAARDETDSPAPAAAVPGAVERLQEVVALDCDATLELLLVWSLHRTARTDERLRLVRSPAWPVDSSATAEYRDLSQLWVDDLDLADAAQELGCSEGVSAGAEEAGRELLGRVLHGLELRRLQGWAARVQEAGWGRALGG